VDKPKEQARGFNNILIPEGNQAKRAKNAIEQLCLKNNYDPFQEMISDSLKLKKHLEKMEVEFDDYNEFGKGLTAKFIESKNKIDKEIAQYVAPKLRSMEIKGEGDAPLMFTINILPDA